MAVTDAGAPASAAVDVAPVAPVAPAGVASASCDAAGVTLIAITTAADDASASHVLASSARSPRDEAVAMSSTRR